MALPKVLVYEYTTYGILLALLIKGQLKKVITVTKLKNKIDELEKERQKISEDIVYVLAFKIMEDSPAEVIFYSTLFRNLKEKGIFDKLVERMHRIMMVRQDYECGQCSLPLKYFSGKLNCQFHHKDGDHSNNVCCRTSSIIIFRFNLFF